MERTKRCHEFSCQGGWQGSLDDPRVVTCSTKPFVRTFMTHPKSISSDARKVICSLARKPDSFLAHGSHVFRNHHWPRRASLTFCPNIHASAQLFLFQPNHLKPRSRFMFQREKNSRLNPTHSLLIESII